jgi:hypothetical protein
MLTGMIEEPLRVAIVQAAAETLGGFMLPVPVFLVLGAAAALIVGFVARRERRPKLSTTLRPAA